MCFNKLSLEVIYMLTPNLSGRKKLGIEVAIATTFLLNRNSVFHSLHDYAI